MILFYNLFITLYSLGVRIAAQWSTKAAAWLDGRKNIFENLHQVFPIAEPVIWIHSASAGEFEQAKPIIEALKQTHPECKILVTFFSPSGFSVGKKFHLADYVFYLPVDTKKNAAQFVELIKPKLVVFVKYDFWYHFLNEVHKKNIPLILVSAIFRENQAFFKWYGGFYLKMLHFFTHLFVQDNISKTLLQKHGVNHCTVSGDTRFDRVAHIAEKFQPVPFIKAFIGNQKSIIAGSTWPDDEKALAHFAEENKDVKLVIAPHEINEPHLKSIKSLFKNAVFYSDLKEKFAAETDATQKGFENVQVLVIDNIGMLSRLYKYAYITYIGGGFTKTGIHNSLEAAVYGKPVVFGPTFSKYREAIELVEKGGALTYQNTEELKGILKSLLHDLNAYEHAANEAFKYVQQNKGATATIINYIQEKRLLTK